MLKHNIVNTYLVIRIHNIVAMYLVIVCSEVFTNRCLLQANKITIIITMDTLVNGLMKIQAFTL